MLMTLLFHVAQSQTFQNTYHPASDDNYVAGAAVSSEYYVIGNTAGYPTAANTVERILFSRYTAGGASSLDRIIYDGANNSHIYNSRDIQMGYSKYTPSPSTSDPPPPCTFNLCPVVAPSAVDISDPNSKKVYLHHRLLPGKPNGCKAIADNENGSLCQHSLGANEFNASQSRCRRRRSFC